MEAFGPLFKEFRLNKGLKLKEVAEGIVTTQFLIKFESGSSDVTLTKFYRLLYRIKVGFDEFMGVYSEIGLEILNEFEAEIDVVVDNHSSIGLQKMRDKYQVLYEGTQDQMFYFLWLILRESNKRFNKKNAEENLLEPIKRYLLRTETWGKYELFLAVYVIDIFDSFELFNLIKCSFSRMSRDKSLKFRLDDFILNSIIIFLLRGELSFANELTDDYLAKLNIPANVLNFYHHIYKQYLKGALLIAQGDSDGLEISQRVIDGLQHFDGYERVAERFKRGLEMMDSANNQYHLVE